MAKRKTRSNDSSKKFPIEIKGILLIIAGVIGFLGFNANVLGTLFKGFAMFLMGSFDFIFLTLLIIWGLYILIKRENPKFFSARIFGLIIFLIGLLYLISFWHGVHVRKVFAEESCFARIHGAEILL